MTATLRYSTSRHQDALVGMAKVAAAGRVQAARQAVEARQAAVLRRNQRLAAAYVQEAREAGAVRIGWKVCFEEGGKWRDSSTLERAAVTLTGLLCHADVECWGIDAAGEYVWTMW